MSFVALAFLAALAVPGASGVSARGAGHALVHLRAHAVNLSAPLAMKPGHNSISGTHPGAAVQSPFQLMMLGEECKCSFVETCSCGAAVKFLDCISDACASGSCNCPPHQYALSCASMEEVCPSLDFGCTADHAKCTKLRETHATGPRQKVLEDLEMLKAKRCMLIEAVRDGWLNADERLEETEVLIEKKLAALKALGGAPPDMTCPGEPAETPRQFELEHNKTGPPELPREQAAPAKGGHTDRVRATFLPGFFVDAVVPHSVSIALFLGGLLILILSTLYVRYQHLQLQEDGKGGSQCGLFSTLCCLFCTPAAICWPIDEAKL